METATIIQEGECQTVRLPKGFHLSTPTVGVRYDGEAIVLEPLKRKVWPEGFFDSIHITDPAFARPDQGQLPPMETTVTHARLTYLLDTDTCISILRQRPGMVQCPSAQSKSARKA